MYYKVSDSNYIQAIGTGPCPPNGMAIDRVEFNALLEVMQSRPIPETGFDYRLKTDLTWEIYKMPESTEADENVTEDDLVDAMREVGVDI